MLLKSIDLWISQDINNFNMFIIIIFLLFIISILLIIIFTYKLGKNDERRNFIQLKINQVIFITLITFIGFYLLTANNNLIYGKQYLIFGVSLSLLSGAIACIYFYIKERF